VRHNIRAGQHEDLIVLVISFIMYLRFDLSILEM